MRQFTIELTTTNACSFRCSYCFESEFKEGTNFLSQNYNQTIVKLKQLINSEWMHEIADRVMITFWGGEPTLNCDFIYKIVNEFADDERVHFYIYTNGSRITDLLPSLLRGAPRFRVQVSYDGAPIHDMRRRTVDGKPTSLMVLNSLKVLEVYNVPFTIKCTITYPDFVYIDKVWHDIYKLNRKYGSNIKYSLTVDYHNVTFEEHKSNIEMGLLAVAKSEYKFFKENEYFLSNIFIDQRKTCNTSYMIAIDTKGYIYPCHGCLYSSRNLIFGNIFKGAGLVEAAKKHYDRFQVKRKTNEECSNCVALHCIKCNVKKCEASNKIDFLSRWYDFTAQKSLCDYYKLAGRIGRGLHKALLEEN